MERDKSRSDDPPCRGETSQEGLSLPDCSPHGISLVSLQPHVMDFTSLEVNK